MFHPGLVSPLRDIELDLEGSNGLMSRVNPERGGKDAGVLCEMPDKAGNERPQEHYHEERQARDPGDLSRVRHQDVQNR